MHGRRSLVIGGLFLYEGISGELRLESIEGIVAKRAA